MKITENIDEPTDDGEIYSIAENTISIVSASVLTCVGSWDFVGPCVWTWLNVRLSVFLEFIWVYVGLRECTLVYLGVCGFMRVHFQMLCEYILSLFLIVGGGGGLWTPPFSKYNRKSGKNCKNYLQNYQFLSQFVKLLNKTLGGLTDDNLFFKVFPYILFLKSFDVHLDLLKLELK